MKKILLTILPLLLIVGCGSDSILDINNLIDRGGLMYAPNDEKPYTGDVFELYEDGKKKLDGNYRKGLMNGKWMYYHENGQIRAQGRFINGDGSYPDDFRNSLKSIYPPIDGRSGKWTDWYENGQKVREGTCKDGEVDGLWTYWYENGQKFSKGTFKDGKEYGLWTFWYENGQKMSVTTWKNDEIISGKCWDEDGNEKDCD